MNVVYVVRGRRNIVPGVRWRCILVYLSTDGDGPRRTVKMRDLDGRVENYHYTLEDGRRLARAIGAELVEWPASIPEALSDAARLDGLFPPELLPGLEGDW